MKKYRDRFNWFCYWYGHARLWGKTVRESIKFAWERAND